MQDDELGDSAFDVYQNFVREDSQYPSLVCTFIEADATIAHLFGLIKTPQYRFYLGEQLLTKQVGVLSPRILTRKFNEAFSS